MGKEKFIAGLQKLGHKVRDDNNRIIIDDYSLKGGRFAGQNIKLGFEVPNDFEVNTPHGPHISPRLIPVINTGSQNHSERVHESPFGSEWEHFSRPYPGWEKTSRTVAVYMAYVRQLLETL